MNATGSVYTIPENDAERVAALERYQIAGSPREAAFDSICTLACQLFSVPISHISFLDANIEHIKAEVGLNGLERVSRSEGFCTLAILEPKLMLIEDASQHQFLANHPHVIGETKIRFYAAAPVITSEGYIIGTLCLIDHAPRCLTHKERELLQQLAKIVMEQTELRYDNIILLEQKDQFIEVASHEMRTPLTTLMAAGQLLQKLNSKDHELIAQMNKNIHKLSLMVNDIFDTMRLTRKTFDIKLASFDLKTVIEHVQNYLQLVHQKELIIDGIIDVELYADEEKIERVLLNLIQNALKYAPGSPVTIQTQVAQGAIRIAVIDEGPGITQDKLSQIFRRYYRANLNNLQTGLGLGLYISAEIIMQHKGEIGVSSEPGKGSSFWFTLP